MGGQGPGYLCVCCLCWTTDQPPVQRRVETCLNSGDKKVNVDKSPICPDPMSTSSMEVFTLKYVSCWIPLSWIPPNIRCRWGLPGKKCHQVLENEAAHPLRLHCDALQTGDGRQTITKASTSCDVRWFIGVVGWLGFGSTSGEEVARGPSCKSLIAS